jgi:hypothetical protein
VRRWVEEDRRLLDGDLGVEAVGPVDRAHGRVSLFADAVSAYRSGSVVVAAGVAGGGVAAVAPPSVGCDPDATAVTRGYA